MFGVGPGRGTAVDTDFLAQIEPDAAEGIVRAAGRNLAVYIPSLAYCGDNGAMIAHSGVLRLKKGWTIHPKQATYFQKMRVDEEPYERINQQSKL